MSNVIHLLPIEPFEERYTEQWFRWWSAGLREQGFNVNVIEGYNVGERKGGNGFHQLIHGYGKEGK